MKKLLLFVFISTLSLMFFACNDTKKQEEAKDSTPTEEVEKKTTATPAEASASSEADDNTAAAVASMKFEEEEFDFGKIQQGDKVTHVFKFTNDGDAPLIITNAKASCGCTIPEYPKDTPIQPGEQNEIKVTFNSAGKKGKQTKPITITANVDGGRKVIKITGEVESMGGQDGPFKK